MDLFLTDMLVDRNDIGILTEKLYHAVCRKTRPALLKRLSYRIQRFVVVLFIQRHAQFWSVGLGRGFPVVTTIFFRMHIYIIGYMRPVDWVICHSRNVCQN